MLQVDPHPVILTIRDNGDSIRVLVYSYDITLTMWGVHRTYALQQDRPLIGDGDGSHVYNTYC